MPLTLKPLSTIESTQVERERRDHRNNALDWKGFGPARKRIFLPVAMRNRHG